MQVFEKCLLKEYKLLATVIAQLVIMTIKSVSVAVGFIIFNLCSIAFNNCYYLVRSLVVLVMCF